LAAIEVSTLPTNWAWAPPQQVFASAATTAACTLYAAQCSLSSCCLIRTYGSVLHMATSLTPRAQLPGLAPTCPSGSLPLDERCADDNEQESTPCPSGTTDDSYAHYAAGALSRFMFYPSLAYNILRSTIQPEYRWYTEIVENLLLGALPFQSMLDDFKQQVLEAALHLHVADFFLHSLCQSLFCSSVCRCPCIEGNSSSGNTE